MKAWLIKIHLATIQRINVKFISIKFIWAVAISRIHSVACCSEIRIYHFLVDTMWKSKGHTSCRVFCRQDWLSVAVNFRHANIASRAVTNELQKQKHIAKTYKCIKNLIMVVLCLVCIHMTKFRTMYVQAWLISITTIFFNGVLYQDYFWALPRQHVYQYISYHQRYSVFLKTRTAKFLLFAKIFTNQC